MKQNHFLCKATEQMNVYDYNLRRVNEQPLNLIDRFILRKQWNPCDVRTTVDYIPCMVFGCFYHISLWLLTSHALFVSSGEYLQKEASLAGNIVIALHSLLPFWVLKSGGKKLYHDFKRKVLDI